MIENLKSLFGDEEMVKIISICLYHPREFYLAFTVRNLGKIRLTRFYNFLQGYIMFSDDKNFSVCYQLSNYLQDVLEIKPLNITFEFEA